jgi:hypothetical protein
LIAASFISATTIVVLFLFREYNPFIMSNKSHGKFGTTINCMDGRSIVAAHDWMRENSDVQFIDSITEPGMDGWLGKISEEQRAWLKRKIEISTKGHGSRLITVVGHDECAGNPVSPEKHHIEAKQGAILIQEILRELNILDAEVIPLWAQMVSGKWVAERI